jgi:hypothetical protein
MVDERPGEEQSLEQIEGDSWGDPPPGATALIATVHELRRKPVGALSAEDLRVLIGQKLGLDVLVPCALARLEREPLLEGDYYPGDVLVAVLGVPSSYWLANPALLATLEKVVASIEGADADVKADIDAFRERMRSVGR